MEDMNTNPMSGVYAPQPAQSRGGHKGILKLLIIVVVALIVIWGAVKLFSGVDSEQVDLLGYTVESAEQGGVVSSFPKEFLLESDAVVSGSYELKYTGNKGTLPTVEYVSAKSLAENIGLFKIALDEGGWAITKEASLSEVPTTNYYALKGGNDINITLTELEGVVTVHIAYIERVPVTE